MLSLTPIVAKQAVNFFDSTEISLQRTTVILKAEKKNHEACCYFNDIFINTHSPSYLCVRRKKDLLCQDFGLFQSSDPLSAGVKQHFCHLVELLNGSGCELCQACDSREVSILQGVGERQQHKVEPHNRKKKTRKLK